DIARSHLLAVVFEAAVPVAGDDLVLAAQQREHGVEVVTGDDGAEPGGVGGNHQRHLAGDDADREVVARLTEHGLRLAPDDHAGTVLGIDDLVPHFEHAPPTSSTASAYHPNG